MRRIAPHSAKYKCNSFEQRKNSRKLCCDQSNVIMLFKYFNHKLANDTFIDNEITGQSEK